MSTSKYQSKEAIVVGLQHLVIGKRENGYMAFQLPTPLVRSPNTWVFQTLPKLLDFIAEGFGMESDG